MTAATEIHPHVERLQLEYDIAAAEFDRVAGALREAIESVRQHPNKRIGVMSEQIQALDLAREQLPQAIEKVAMARGVARDAAYDMAAVKLHKAQILAAIKQIAAWERELLKLDKQADKAIDFQDGRIDRQLQADEDYAERVAAFQELSISAQELFQGLSVALQACWDIGRQAVAERNANRLELKQNDARGLTFKTLYAHTARLQALRDECRELNHAACTEARLQSIQFHTRSKGRLEEIERGLPALKRQYADLMALKVAPVDVAKALKLLGLPAKAKSPLAKALVGPEESCIRKLGELGAEAGLATGGKQMLEQLRRARLV